jgi:hypothetical protein
MAARRGRCGECEGGRCATAYHRSCQADRGHDVSELYTHMQITSFTLSAAKGSGIVGPLFCSLCPFCYRDISSIEGELWGALGPGSQLPVASRLRRRPCDVAPAVGLLAGDPVALFVDGDAICRPGARDRVERVPRICNFRGGPSASVPDISHSRSVDGDAEIGR